MSSLQSFKEIPGMEDDELPYTNPGMNNHKSSIETLTDPKKEIEKLRLTLQNKILDNDGKEVIIGKPLLNETGINSVVGQVRALVNQVTVLSNLEDKHENALVEYFYDTLIINLMLHRKKYDINNDADRTVILFQCLGTVIVCLRRGYKGDDKKFWKGQVQEYEYRTVSPQKKSILPFGNN